MDDFEMPGEVKYSSSLPVKMHAIYMYMPYTLTRMFGLARTS